MIVVPEMLGVRRGEQNRFKKPPLGQILDLIKFTERLAISLNRPCLLTPFHPALVLCFLPPLGQLTTGTSGPHVFSLALTVLASAAFYIRISCQNTKSRRGLDCLWSIWHHCQPHRRPSLHTEGRPGLLCPEPSTPCASVLDSAASGTACIGKGRGPEMLLEELRTGQRAAMKVAAPSLRLLRITRSVLLRQWTVASSVSWGIGVAN